MANTQAGTWMGQAGTGARRVQGPDGVPGARRGTGAGRVGRHTARTPISRSPISIAASRHDATECTEVMSSTPSLLLPPYSYVTGSEVAAGSGAGVRTAAVADGVSCSVILLAAL